jgi:hypothetical protein
MVDPQPFKADPGSKGVYGVNESGVEFAYGDKEPDFATTPEDFLDQFRYVYDFVFLVCCAFLARPTSNQRCRLKLAFPVKSPYICILHSRFLTP